MRLAPLRTIVAVALLGVTAAPAAASDRVASVSLLPAAVATSTTPAIDTAATARLHAAADDRLEAIEASLGRIEEKGGARQRN